MTGLHQWAVAILVFCGVAYHLLSIVAAIRFRSARSRQANYRPPVSILKPLRGRDPKFYEALRSHVTQQYPQFEILCGVADANDPALEDVRRLQREFPAAQLSIHITASDAPNAKVGSMEILARAAQYEVLLVNDGDIRVEPDYLTRVIGPLAETDAGVVTCLYRAEAASPAALAEALSIETDFAPGVLVAHLLGTGGFALGATMAFRRANLEKIGGFAAIREYLADDYQLGARIAALPSRVILSDVVVSTNLGAVSWRSAWKHQLRWARTIRVSRPGGYWGLLVTQTTLWSLVAALAGLGSIALLGLMIRLAGAALAIWALGDLSRLTAVILVPLRDLAGTIVWVAGLGGSTVDWRGTTLRLHSDGRMRPL
jgi:ceramide glucosyltransferase